MTTFDLTPLFRSTVGFDSLANLFDSAFRVDDAPSYPPYNIEAVDEDKYRITMAVAGFGEDELDVTVEDNRLTISGKHREEERNQDEDSNRRYLHRGIATRAFERRFELAPHVKVVGADLKDGLLQVELEREIPEEMKPRKIEIGKPSGAKKLEQKKAA